MRKIFLGSAVALALACAVFGLTACDTEKELGSLEDFSKPYTGIYECEELTLGGEDKLDAFDYIKLDLGDDGNFTLSYKTQQGNAGSLDGAYRMDPAREEITFRAARGGARMSRTFPVRNGVICIDANVLGRLVYAEFRME